MGCQKLTFNSGERGKKSEEEEAKFPNKPLPVNN